MHTSCLRRKPAAIVASALVAVGVFAAVAAAFSGGGAQMRMDNRDSTASATTNVTAAWVNLAGSNVSVFVPTNSSSLINARFTAESQCQGAAGEWCSVRIVAVSPAGAVTELDPGPVGSLDFAFDTAGTDDRSEANAMERSRRLPAGSWTIWVQRRVTAGQPNHVVDDWHFAVETSA